MVNGETDSRITETLAAGSYTVEATTYGEGVSGEFSLSVVTAATPPSTDGCFQTLGGLTAGVSRNGAWNGDCASTHRSGSYARFYSFSLSEQAEVQIDLTSSEDTYLYLLRGSDSGGTVLGENDDVVNGETDSRITETLAAGSYTVEATTYGEGVSGEFSLSVVTAATPPPPADTCEYTLTTAPITAPPGGAISGQWTGDCASTHQAGSYARFYSFTLNSFADVTIDLESSIDTLLYLLEEAGTGGAVLAENDDVESGNTNSRITEFLSAGTYTIEATTYKPGVTGDFTLTVTSITVTVTPQGDREALVALYNATGGPNWRNNHNWLSNAPLGQWYGVTTDSSGRVTELDLHDNGLVGRIPSELGGLSSLRRLFIHQNQLNGGIPAELGSLSNLTWLVLHTNQLSGRIPAELGNLSNLVFLSLGHNQLSGGIPANLAQLTQLINLNLRDNRLSGRIPIELGSLSNLGGLYLNRNQLSGQIPSQLGNLSNLEHLHLSHNRLSGKIPSQLGNLSNLTWVLLSGNQLTGCIPQELESVANTDFAALGLPFCGDGSPDLIVNRASVSESNPDAGAFFTLYAQVHNQGDGASAATTLRYYRSGDDTISTRDTEIGRNDIVPLGASETWYPPSIGLNAPTLPGTYYYGACVDPVPGESDTRNNCSAADTVTVGDSGSLPVVESPSVSDSSLEAGQLFTFYATVRNPGSVRSAATTLRYYRSGNSSISSSDTEVGTDPVGGLPANGTSRQSIVLTAPLVGGTYYYGACVDSVPGFPGTNDSCTSGVRVTSGVSPPIPPVAPVVESPSVSDSSLEAGQLFTFYATVRNPGSVRSAATTLRYYRSGNSSISSSDTEVGTDPVGGLPANGVSNEWIDLYAPSSSGTYYYGACVDSVPGFPHESDRCTSGVRVTVSEVSEVSPDLVVESVSVSDNSLEAGQSFTFYATVRNRGDGRSASTTLRHLRSINASISNNLDTPEGTDPVGSLPANRTSRESIELTAPTVGGTYYYGACVDAVQGESDPNNNCSSGVRVTVTEVSPDLVVVSPSVSDSSLDAGQSFLLRATVRNRGSGRSALTTLRYFLSVNSTINDGGIDIEVGSNRVPGIPASGTSLQSLVETAPSVGGTYYYGACVDAVPGESDPNNNCSSGVRVTVSEVSPDLVVISPSLRDKRGLAAPLTSDINADPGSSFTLYATAHNRGDGSSNSTTLRYYRSGNDTISTSDTVVGTDPVGGLPANGVSNEWIDLYAPSSSGTYYYGACVDEVPGESNTQNNCSDAVEVTVPPVRVTDRECTHTSNLFGRTYTLTGTVVASRSLSNVTITGYIVRYANEREVDRDRVGEYDLGSMSANQPEDFEMSKFFLFNILERQDCDFEFEWEY